MATEYYLPDGDNEREVWLTNFQTNLAALASLASDEWLI